MKIVFIYGPPGVGKLTVARELAKITGFKLFHNHLTTDLVSAIFPFGHKVHSNLMEKIRLTVIETAAKENIKGIILTYVYFVGEDDKFVKDVVRIVKRYDGKIYFVKLSCEHGELHKRIKHPERKKFTKVKSITLLKKLMKEHDMAGNIPFGRNLPIDNTHMSPKVCARKIKNYFKL
jgi:tRNA uridine 5-carbamoylmethylation protein Kti12